MNAAVFKVLRHALLLAILLCPAAQADPAIWQVKGKHNTLYLLGTIHMLPSDEQLTNNIQRAYGEAEQLLMEIDMDDIDPVATQVATTRLGLLPDGQNLVTQLNPATQRKLKIAADKVGLDSQLLGQFQPWLAAVTLEQLTYAKQGFAAESGIEMQLTRQAIQDHKSIQGLETLDEQLGLLANLDQAVQRDFLRQTLDELDESTDDLAQLLQAWRNGDTQHLQTMLYEGLTENPQL
ncbi:MAG: TraB/GumN family protein, partial [Steroidobacteraceae bacterium]